MNRNQFHRILPNVRRYARFSSVVCPQQKPITSELIYRDVLRTNKCTHVLDTIVPQAHWRSILVANANCKLRNIEHHVRRTRLIETSPAARCTCARTVQTGIFRISNNYLMPLSWTSARLPSILSLLCCCCEHLWLASNCRRLYTLTLSWPQVVCRVLDYTCDWIAHRTYDEHTYPQHTITASCVFAPGHTIIM